MTEEAFGTRIPEVPLILNEGGRFVFELEAEDEPWPDGTEAAFHLAGQVWSADLVDAAPGRLNVLRFVASKDQVQDAIAADPQGYTLQSGDDLWAWGQVAVKRPPGQT